ncbi:hypothetical protein R5H30_05100 [Sulfitobacter sp. D35]|uniref:hypothetical protein n=1 Tax=Sulfitobacter sp. D35 TaxID=3083252 RepID=UPI00296EDEBE|nr:hypothetical protein [Sulfitobacter sp. D35]MDW4497350.1 hypothetical protein [Sulfitobacter sp. D35]
MRSLALIPAAFLAACATTAPEPDPVTGSLPFFGTGYRFMNDSCRRLGEDDYTNQFLDDSADLVGCPEDMENLGVFVTDTGAIEVDRREGFVIYSVPRG